MNRISSAHKKSITSAAVLTTAGLLAYSQYLRSSVIANEAPQQQQQQQSTETDLSIKPKKKRFSLPASQYPVSYPGLYIWGSNAGGVVAPGYESLVQVVKTPYRIPFFDGRLLRDVVLKEDLGVAVLDNGDVVQWGNDYFGAPSSQSEVQSTTTTTTDLVKKKSVEPTHQPEVTLKGKNITKVTVSEHKAVYGLNSSGSKVYAWPVSKKDLKTGPKPISESSWLKPWKLIWRSKDSVSYTTINMPALGWGEYITDVQAGNDHILVLTSKGRVFSGASGVFPEHQPKESHGQYGLARFSQFETPPEPGVVHEIKSFKNKVVDQIACGDYHSIARTLTGDVYVFGDNTLGQLGLPYTYKNAIAAVPTLLPIHKLYPRKILPTVTNIAAGGSTSFVTVQPVLNTAEFYREFPGEEEEKMKALVDKDVLDGVARNVFAFGKGLKGQLGNGNFVHAQSSPASVKYFAQLKEYSEDLGKRVPIDITKWSIGPSHVAVALGGVSSSSSSSTKKDGTPDLPGQDVLIWGGNDFWQVGTGKRNSLPTPQRIPSLESSIANASLPKKKQPEIENGVEESTEEGVRAAVEYIDNVDSYNNRLQLAHHKPLTFKDPSGHKYKTTVSQDIVVGGYATAIYTKRP
ncbi:uncharacterized protein SAPINGB_P005586 [Magnusiomyces paraingens]|uniref:Uncharacterized protein n=1 Tax=Magnusiomyces paraingens TaxID=2606893 RepID=A0A5E8C0H2_9ASCO|nr:uncharacterized protein SAPINGB_P005586 [Saprochaete ingens]VVT57204.1 unnamed protein product [Saprochaete ingens]